MRIFYAANGTPNMSLTSSIWRYNLLLPLRDIGHEVIEFEYELSETFRHLNTQNPKHVEFVRTNRPRVSAELLRQIERAHRHKPIDLFFSYFYDACVLPKTIEAIRSMGIVTVNWYCNAAHQLHLVQEIAPHYDWCLVPERARLQDYVNIGARPLYCQEAANPHVYKPYSIPQEYDVTFVGQAYGDRPAYVQEMLRRGFDIRVWGPGWDRHGSRNRAVNLLINRVFRPHRAVMLPVSAIGGILSDEEMIRLFSRSRINLGFSSCGNSHRSGQRILQVRLRDFEIPMSGGFYMVEYMEELEEFYDIGKEIVCYRNPAELAEKVAYYLKHETEREGIRRAGHERCLRDHTWQKRFETALREMGLGPS